MNAWPSFVQVWLADMAVLATVLLAAALALRLMLRDAGGRVRLAWATWLGIALAATVTLLPGWPRYEWTAIGRSLRGEPAAARTDHESLLPVALDWGVLLNPTTPLPMIDDRVQIAVAPPQDWRELATLGWITGALVGLGWIALGRWQAHKLLRHSQTAPPWIRDQLAQVAAPRQPHADVRTSTRLASAVALRAHRPAIVLPHDSATPSQAPAVRAALAHEWAHICHGDLWLLVLERLLLPLLALHPLFWWLRRSTRLDQELLADAAAAGDKPVEYAEALVAWAKTSSPPPASLAALAFWDRPTNLTRRVHMILHQPRAAASWFSRMLSFAAFACLLALIGGLSVITLEPLAAEDEPKQRVPASVVEHPLAPLPTSAPATSGSQVIEFACTLIEVEPADLAQALSGGDRPPLPSPEIELGIQTMVEWSAAQARLAARPNTKVVSRPRLRTYNNRHASIEMGAQPKGRSEVIGLKIVLHPELLPKIGSEQQLLLSIGFERTSLDDSHVEFGKLPNAMTRKVQTKVAVPLGKIVVVADPSNRTAGTQRPLLLAIEPRIVASQNKELGTAIVVDPSQPAGKVQERLRELQSQLDRLEAAPLDIREGVAVREAMLRLQRDIGELIEDPRMMPALTDDGVFRLTTTYTLRHTDPVELKEALKKRLDEEKIPNVVIAAHTSNKFFFEDRSPIRTLVVHAPVERFDVVRRLVSELAPELRAASPKAAPKKGSVNGRPANITSVPRSIASTESSVPAVAANSQRITNQNSTEQKLLELDLREAEINLQSTQAEHERYAELRSKNPGAVSESELRQGRLKVELAQIQVERMKVRLDAHRAANPPATPATPRR